MIDWPYFLKNYLSFIDVTMLLIWLVIIAILTFFLRKNIQNRQFQRFYSWNILFKLVFALAFAFYYSAVLKGGDTNAYWHSASLMADLFYKSPVRYVQHLMSDNSMTNLYAYFNSETGYPFSDIYYNSENYFTAKVYSVFAILTYKGYLAGTVMMAFLTALVHWRFFKMIKRSSLKTNKLMPLMVLFMPSLAFWSSGISKDTLMLIATFGMVFWVYSILLNQRKINLRIVLILLLYVYLILHVRTTILAIVVVPFLFTAMRHVYRLMGDNRFLITLTKIAFNAVVVIGFVLFLMSSAKDTIIHENAAFNQALITQQDFTVNKTYGDNKYNLQLENTDFFSILAKTPLILATGIYRPFLWEALSIALILNGIESVLLLLMSARFFLFRVRARMRLILGDSFLNYSLIFVLLTAFIAGFISILFGVLVRFRAPLLPFIGLLLTVEPERKQVREEN